MRGLNNHIDNACFLILTMEKINVIICQQRHKHWEYCDYIIMVFQLFNILFMFFLLWTHKTKKCLKLSFFSDVEVLLYNHICLQGPTKGNNKRSLWAGGPYKQAQITWINGSNNTDKETWDTILLAFKKIRWSLYKGEL